jgi:hypothetical protein
MVKKLLFSLSFLLVLMVPNAKASHVLGGEMSYRCLGGGIYEFTVNLYRDCFGIPWDQPSVTVNGPSGSFNLPRLPGATGVADISQRCVTATFFGCGANPATGPGPNGTVAKFTYKGTTNLSALAAPTAAGHVFTMTNIPVNVRNNNNNMGGGSSMGLRVIMYPFIDPATGIALTPAQICDNSPEFVEDPAALQVLNPLDTARFSNFAFERDLDSMVYKTDFPLTGTLMMMFYQPPFTVLNPLPNTPPVVPAGTPAMNPVTGVLTFRPNQAGNFLTCVKVESWRCGQKISEVFRDFQMQIISPAGGAPPYIPGNLTTQRAPVIKAPYVNSSGQERWEIYAYYEDTLVVPIAVNDSFPFSPTANSFSIAAKGQSLSILNVDSAGCDAPPCATIRGLSDPNPPAAIINAPSSLNRTSGLPLGLGYSNLLGQGGLKLIWTPQIPANQLFNSCQNSLPVLHTYRFNFFAIDNHCPVVGESSQTLEIKLLENPTFQSPSFDSISQAPINQILHFNLGIDTISLDWVDIMNQTGPLSVQDSIFLRQKAANRRINSFRFAKIWKSSLRNGPYLEAGRITNPFSTTWLDTSSFGGQFYFIETFYGRNALSTASSDTLPNCNIQNISITGTSGNFICSLGSTLLNANLSGPNFSFQWFRNAVPITNATSSSFQVINNPGIYNISVYDSTQGCSKMSNDFQLSYFPPPFQNQEICAVSVDPITGKNIIIWNKNLGSFIAKYMISRETTVSGQFDPIGTVLVDSFSTFIDTSATTQSRSWKYRIQIEDSCGFRSNMSQLHQTIHLSANLGINNDVNLIWTPYQGVSYNTQRILRSHNGSPFILIGSVPSTNFSFTDLNAPSGSKAYLIEIDIPGGCSPSARLASVNSINSNLVNLGAGVSLRNIENTKPSLHVFPNPSTGSFTIKMSSYLNETVSLKILDAQGRLIRVVEIKSGDDQIVVDLNSQGAGLYFLHCETLNWTQKLNIIH